jgi:acyl phosphate:glycerol-3-phosphate acyltransferase
MGPLLLGAVLAYLVGSIPFGLLLTRAAGLGDIRAIGSGNIGATNVLRTGKKGLAALTLVFDAGKGALCVLAAQHYGADMTAEISVAAVVGHMFPPWLRFKGGKGVSTAAGVMLAYLWPAALAALATWLVLVVLTRYSSLAAIVAAISAPLYALYFAGATEPTAIILIIALLVLMRHAENIRRLLRGEERRVAFGRMQR